MPLRFNLTNGDLQVKRRLAASQEAAPTLLSTLAIAAISLLKVVRQALALLVVVVVRLLRGDIF